MHEMFISPEEFEEFRDIQIRPRWGWPVAFSCNQHYQVCPWNRYGYTPESERVYVEGLLPRLDQIVRMVLLRRRRGDDFS